MSGDSRFLMDSGIVLIFHEVVGVGENRAEDKRDCLFGNKGGCPLTRK